MEKTVICCVRHSSEWSGRGRSDIWKAGKFSYRGFTWESLKELSPQAQCPRIILAVPETATPSSKHALQSLAQLSLLGEGRNVCGLSLGRYKEGFNTGPGLPSGLLRLEELVRGFLISKETLSVRMLDDSRDPTPLLKEIRDDKVSTIIIDANASISHLVLRKVGPLFLLSIELGRQITSVVGSGLRRVCFATAWSHDLGQSLFLSVTRSHRLVLLLWFVRAVSLQQRKFLVRVISL